MPWANHPRSPPLFLLLSSDEYSAVIAELLEEIAEVSDLTQLILNKEQRNEYYINSKTT